VAGWIFTEVPKASIEDAIKLFKKAEELNPKPWKENKFFLGKCHVQKGEYHTAIEWLDSAAEIKSNLTEDVVLDEEISKLVKKYASYRRST